MIFKKLIPTLESGIIEAGFDKEPRILQIDCIPKIKSGADLTIIAPAGSGKSTALVMGLIQELKKAIDDAPRAIVFSDTKETALELEAQFKLIGRHTDLRIYSVFDKGNIQDQKDKIYEGLDILIGTPKRIHDLVTVSGISTMNLKLLVVDDAEMVFQNRHHPVILRIAESVQKLQCLIFAEKWSDKFQAFSDRLIKNPMVITFEK